MSWHPDMPEEYRNAIVTGDARELAKRIPDESVDLILTDPPYPREFLHTYRALADAAVRVLKVGGYVFAYVGTETLPEVMAAMQVEGLTWFWLDVLLHSGGEPRLWYKHLMSGHKPVVIFTKGSPRRLPWRSTVHADGMDKRFHKWGQAAGYPLRMIEMLTDPGDVILDPFMGGGTVPAVCKMLGRNYVAFEIDPDTAERARERVMNTQPPLPGIVVEQEEMTL